MKFPLLCLRCNVGPAVHYCQSKYTGERFLMCGECGGLWINLKTFNAEKGWGKPNSEIFYNTQKHYDDKGDLDFTGYGSGDAIYMQDAEYHLKAGRPDNFQDDPNYENWTTEEWEKYHEPWINCDDEFYENLSRGT